MKYKEVMKTPEKKEWTAAFLEEHERVVKHGAFKPVKLKDVPKGEKMLTTTWAMKKKSNGNIELE